VIAIIPVRTGIESADRVEIRSQDLSDGDDVVIGSRAGLRDGMKVQPKIITLASAVSPRS